MSSKTIIDKVRPLGPLFVAIAAFFWATDYIVRPKIIEAFASNPNNASLNDILSIVFYEHVLAMICLVFILIAFYLYSDSNKEKFDFRKIKSLNKLEIFSALFIGVAGSALGLIFFTLAFAEAANLTQLYVYSGFDQTLFVQKIQPLFAIFFAFVILKEKFPKIFYFVVVISMLGVFLVTFGVDVFPYYNVDLSSPSVRITIYSLLAAFCWGTSTVFGKVLVENIDYPMTTFVRYSVATIFLLLVNVFFNPRFFSTFTLAINTFWYLLFVAFVPGVASLFVYYFGLKNSKASYATIAELTFPFSTIIINHVFHSETMFLMQWIGGGLVLLGITWLALDSISNARDNHRNSYNNKIASKVIID